ncbi:MAG: hypothetical protein DMG97_27215 [Acidobacteria bacterium]|nr:MAG: hypothetical protein DMG97_27215 [Acidobacteriota bacterium]
MGCERAVRLQPSITSLSKLSDALLQAFRTVHDLFRWHSASSAGFTIIVLSRNSVKALFSAETAHVPG